MTSEPPCCASIKATRAYPTSRPIESACCTSDHDNSRGAAGAASELTSASRFILRLRPSIHAAAAVRAPKERNATCGIPGMTPSNAKMHAVSHQASTLLNWSEVCSCSDASPETRVTMIAVAMDNSKAGTCATRPSPTASVVYRSIAVPMSISCWSAPTSTPPKMLMKRIRMPATASPRTNLLAPSIEP